MPVTTEVCDSIVETLLCNNDYVINRVEKRTAELLGTNGMSLEELEQLKSNAAAKFRSCGIQCPIPLLITCAIELEAVTVALDIF
ncbi:TPA: hypothetical protein ACX6Q6_003571 [Photobacterium damselae]